MDNSETYRPEIDGLRAIAVLSVVLYHFGATWLPGGFTGVDIFFVISGYVITRKLRGQITAGEFSILGFYDGRIRRIFPALLVMLTFTMAVGWFVLAPGDYSDLGQSAAYASFGLSNLFFYWNTGYFDQASELQPLLHTWSLGVEEQFYIAWPAMLWLAMSMTRSKTVLAIICTGVALVGLVYAQNYLSLDSKGAFYLPHARAWELATGAALVFLPAAPAGVSSKILSSAGVMSIAYSLAFIHATDVFPGVNALFGCLGAAFIIWSNTTTPVAAVLSVRPAVIVGLLSYSLYLWHWPVLVLYKHYLNGAMPGPTEVLLLLVLAVCLAHFSYRFIEQPFRKTKNWQPMLIVAAGVVASGSVALVGLGLFQAGGITARISSQAKEVSNLDTMWQWNCRAQPLTEFDGTFCVFGANWDTASERAVVWGDSHAEHMAPLIDSFARHNGISFAVLTECPAALGRSVWRQWAEVPTYVSHCASRWATVTRAIRRDPKIGLVVMASSWNPLSYKVNGTRSELSGIQLVDLGLTEAISAIERQDLDIIVVDQMPNFSIDPAACAFAAVSGLIRKPCNGLGENGYKASVQVEAARFPGMDLLASAFPNVKVIHPREPMCKDGTCLTIMDGQYLFRDANHIRRNLPPKILDRLSRLIGLREALDATVEDQQISKRHSDPILTNLPHSHTNAQTKANAAFLAR